MWQSLAEQPTASGLAREVRELQHRLPGADVRHGVADPAAATGRELHDGSIQIHAGHGADRQVEVLRALLPGLLAHARHDRNAHTPIKLMVPYRRAHSEGRSGPPRRLRIR